MLAFVPTSPFSPFLVLFLLRLALASSLLPTRPPSSPPPHPPWQRRGHGRGNANRGTRVQRDDEHLFYLRSRGLSEAEARRLLTYGFASEILVGVSLDALRDKLDARVRARLGDC